MRGGRDLLRSLRVPIRKVLRAERRLVVVHQEFRLLHEQLHLEPMHLRAFGLLVQRPRAVMQRVRVPIWHVHLSSRYPGLQLALRRMPCRAVPAHPAGEQRRIFACAEGF